jgi:hypothetical protein
MVVRSVVLLTRLTISKGRKGNNPHSGDFLSIQSDLKQEFDHIVDQSMEQVMQFAQD